MNKLKRVPLLLTVLTIVIIALATCTACDMFSTEQPDFSKELLPEISARDDEPLLKSETTVRDSISDSIVLITIGDRVASGLIIDNTGTFVTDKGFLSQAVSSSEAIFVRAGETDYTDVKVVKRDLGSDLAVLKINGYVGSGRSFSLSSTISDRSTAYLVGYDTDRETAIEKVFILNKGDHAVVIRENTDRTFLKGAVLADAASGKVYGVYTTTGDVTTKGGSYKVSSIEAQKNIGDDVDLTIPEFQRSTKPCVVNVQGTSWSDCEVDWGTSLISLMDQYYMREYSDFANPGHILTGFSIYNEETEETSVTRDPDYKICSDMTITPEWQEIGFVAGEGVTLDSGYADKTYYFDALNVEVSVQDGYVWCGFYRGDKSLSTASDNPLKCNAAIKDASSKVTIEARTTTFDYKSNYDEISHIGIRKQYQGTLYYRVGEKITLTATADTEVDFLGWYDGETLLSQDTTCTITLTAEEKHYVAKWDVLRITLESNLPETGEYYMLEEGRVTFDLNGVSGTAPASQTGTLTYPDIPTREGYVFAGWYDNAACEGTPFDFSANHSGTTTLYAKWIAHEGDGVWHVGNSYERLTMYSQNSSDMKYYAFVPLVSETITFYSSNNSSDTVGFLYDSEKVKLKYDDDGANDNRNFKITHSVTAGQLYYVSPTAYGTGNTDADIHLLGTAKPSDGGTVENKKITSSIVSAGAEVTVYAEETEYTWLGWYNGDILVSSEYSFDFRIPDGDVTLTATWQVYNIELSSNVTGGGEQYFSGGMVVFNLNGASGTAPAPQTGTLTYPDIPTRAGYVFAGWYDNAACEGTPFDFTANHRGTTTLYAKWIAHSGNDVWYVGSVHNNLYTYSATATSIKQYYAVVPLVSGQITFYSTYAESNLDTIGTIYDSNKNSLGSNDDGGDGRNFKLTYNVTAGQLYYVSVVGYNTKAGYSNIYLTGTSKPSDGGNIEKYVGEKGVAPGESVTICATVNDGYNFLGWYDESDGLVSSDPIYTYVPKESARLTAKYEEI